MDNDLRKKFTGFIYSQSIFCFYPSLLNWQDLLLQHFSPGNGLRARPREGAEKGVWDKWSKNIPSIMELYTHNWIGVYKRIFSSTLLFHLVFFILQHYCFLFHNSSTCAWFSTPSITLLNLNYTKNSKPCRTIPSNTLFFLWVYRNSRQFEGFWCAFFYISSSYFLEGHRKRG